MSRNRQLVHWAVAATLMMFVLRSLGQAEENWPRWRGPQQNGHTLETGLPVEWGDESLIWKAPLEGHGYSSPVLWGERIFLTAALEGNSRRAVLAIDRNDGRLLWQRVAWSGKPEKIHATNTGASATCVTDGERVYACFGFGGLHCYTVEGKHIWSKDLGPLAGPWGTAASPVLVGDLLIQNCDADEDAYLIALDKRSGETVWRIPRPNFRGWSTPVLFDVGGRAQLVMNGHTGVTAYEPATGNELWHCDSFAGRGTPTVVWDDQRVYAVNGLAGDMYSVRIGGSGNVTTTHLAWHTPRGGGRDLPSPILVGGYLLVVNMKGVLTCYDSESGEELWKDRLPGNHSASPIAAEGLVYFQSHEGEAFVIKPGPTMQLVARNRLTGGPGELFRSAYAVSQGQFFIRSDQNLYCIGRRTRAGGE